MHFLQNIIKIERISNNVLMKYSTNCIYLFQQLINIWLIIFNKKPFDFFGPMLSHLYITVFKIELNEND